VDIEQIRVGMKARVHFDAYPELELPATLSAIGTYATGGKYRPGYIRQIPVRLQLEKIDSRVIPNLSASVDLITKIEPEAVLVSRESVFYEGDAQPVAFVKTPDGWEKRELELGPGNNLDVAVRSGVSEGEVVASERPTLAGISY
jgi:HlyD family secretion protein